jgi:hypothetical protein
MIQPKKYKTIKQPKGSLICVAAVAAMVVGKGLRYAENRMKLTYDRKMQGYYYKYREILGFVGSHGIFCGAGWHKKVTGREFRSYSSLRWETPTSVAAIMSVKSGLLCGACHLVFWDGRRVRDPDPSKPDRCKIIDYDIIDWIPLCYLDDGKL